MGAASRRRSTSSSGSACHAATVTAATSGREEYARVHGERAVRKREQRIDVELPDGGKIERELRQAQQDVGERTERHRGRAAHAVQQPDRADAAQHVLRVERVDRRDPEDHVAQGFDVGTYAIDFSKAVWLRIKTNPLWLAGAVGGVPLVVRRGDAPGEQRVGEDPVDRVEQVNGATWVYTSGEVAGRLPLMGWVTVLAWQGEPEVARREAAGWRLFGFQD